MSGGPQRKLAAIVSADVAGYSRLMGKDEEGTLAALKAHRNAIDPVIFNHGGRIVKTTGDGLLLDFPTVIAAVRSSLDGQRVMAERDATLPAERRMQFRVGIHVGEVMVDEEDLFGDTINIAARLQEFAEPGGISVSGAARDAVHKHIDEVLIDLGPQSLKNIAEPITVWRIDMGGTRSAALNAAAAQAQSERAAIAVLPFDNMSPDAEQEYFADGIAGDIITALSRVSRLRVIARNSSFANKGQAKDIRLIAAELDARYVLEGSVRKGGNRVRVNAQLIDGVSGQHIWAERYDRDLVDIFDLQDDITANIVSRVAPEIWRAEGERVRHHNIAQLDAWDLHLRASSAFYEGTRDGYEQAERLCRQAIEKDSNYAPGYELLSCSQFQLFVNGYRRGTREAWRSMLDLAAKATRLDPDDASILAFYAGTLAHMGEYDQALELSERAVSLNPSISYVYQDRGRALFYDGQYKAAVGAYERCMQLSPNDPMYYTGATMLGYAQYCLRNHEAALSWANEALRVSPNFTQAIGLQAASLARLDRIEEAKASIARFLEAVPLATATRVAGNFRLRKPEDVDHYRAGLVKAGLPEE